MDARATSTITESSAFTDHVVATSAVVPYAAPRAGASDPIQAAAGTPLGLAAVTPWVSSDPARFFDTRPLFVGLATAQTPAVRRSYAPPVAAPRRAKRLSAPLALRSLVILEILVLFVGLGALVALHSRPTWFDAIRNGFNTGTPSVGAPAKQTVAAKSTGGQIQLATSSANTVAYVVPTATYSLVLNITHPCWVVVKSPADSSTPLVARTYLPSDSPISIALHGSASITLAARADSLTVTSGSVSKTIASPLLGVAYTFTPAS